mmetsp:Transcript_22780/g.35012  ORF Transcript_22780/g.35012 Transcript_22780/m.35012 type:complete len:125 (-) Transcript_22780:549-923(-)
MRFYNALLSLLPLLGQVVKSQSNYAPLSCNANTVVDINAPIDTCTPFSQLVNETLSADPNGRIVVPCGTCSIVDYTDGSTIDLPNGLNIVGRLFQLLPMLELQLLTFMFKACLTYQHLSILTMN